jgi:hypothetical protein
VVPGGGDAVERPAHGGAEARCGRADRGCDTRVRGRALRWFRVQRRARGQIRAGAGSGRACPGWRGNHGGDLDVRRRRIAHNSLARYGLGWWDF